MAECQAIIDACEKNKVKLAIGYRIQHEPNTQTLISFGKEKKNTVSSKKLRPPPAILTPAPIIGN
ncbi:MAG: hypothetical protein R2788_10625 [Saprospiraceae bacterium]